MPTHADGSPTQQAHHQSSIIALITALVLTFRLLHLLDAHTQAGTQARTVRQVLSRLAAVLRAQRHRKQGACGAAHQEGAAAAGQHACCARGDALAQAHLQKRRK